MIRLAALVLAASSVSLVPTSGPLQGRGEELTKAYHELFDARDRAGMLALWSEHRGAILVTIDADLEGSLALWERDPTKPDRSAIAALHERALWGAELASEATGNPIFDDYASAFVGWGPDEKRAFRAGQKAHGEARGALKSGELEQAAEKGRACRELAEPLGDWWGLAMGLAAEGEALFAMGEHADAADALARARQVYHDLGLTGSEYRAVATLSRALAEDGPPARARAATRHALRLARELGDEQGVEELQARMESLRG